MTCSVGEQKKEQRPILGRQANKKGTQTFGISING